MDVRRHIRTAVRQLADAGSATAQLDAEVLLAHALGVDRQRLYLDPDLSMTSQQSRLFEAMLARRAGGEPVAYITGVREFWSLPFMVNSATLIPRPDSETLVEATGKAAKDRFADAGPSTTILDLGTGSGCLLIALLSVLPAARGLGTDCNSAAVSVAAANARDLGLGGRAHFIVSDWDGAIDADRRFDIVISNPPYVRSPELACLDRDVRDFEPLRALDGGSDGLEAYRRICPIAARRLDPGGIAAVEIGMGQGDAVRALADGAGLRLIEPAHDLAGRERVLIFERKSPRR